MPSNAELLALADRYLYANYRPARFVLERGAGCEVWDVEGKRYLDLCAGVAVCSVGHAHPRYVSAIAEQVATLGHVSNWFYNARNIEAAERLSRISGMDRVFFCNSGCEANSWSRSKAKGGVPAPPGLLSELRALCDASGALLLVDEVQTGIGRLGSWFGYQQAGILPDAVSAVLRRCQPA